MAITTKSVLDSNIVEQLKSVYASLKQQISLVYDDSPHENQQELVTMLQEIASTNSDKIIAQASGNKNPIPCFKLKYKNSDSGISFIGIPSGHEFTSLVLAVLNLDGSGKFPDDQILNRIKNLKGPIRLKTYISLTCENCPDIVQALNMMSIVHQDFKHTMVDGAYVQDEIKRLGIQGVPTVMDGDKLISSGRINLVDLITKLEKHFGKNESNQSEENLNLGTFDVTVIGGGPAGVSAAIYAARKGLKTAMLAEKMGGQVGETKGIENFVATVYTEGPKLVQDLANHLKEYPIHVLEHRRVKEINTNEKLKKIELESDEFLHSKAIIVATGAKWRELGIKGEKEYLGRGVAFCPHCDGPLFKGKNIAVIGGGNSGVEAAIDLAGIVGHLTLFEFAPTLKADQVLVDKLKSLKNVEIIKNARTHEIIGNGEKVVGMSYEDRENQEMKTIDLDGIFVQIGLVPNSHFLKDTAVELSPFGEIVIDNKCRTKVQGIYAAGDVTTVPYKQIVIAMGEGAKASLAAFEDQMLD